MSETSSSATPLSARDAIAQHVNNTTVVSEALESARESAREYGVAVPDTMTGAALTSLMALTSARRDGHPAAVIAAIHRRRSGVDSVVFRSPLTLPQSPLLHP